ncbi:glycosyltransferase [Acinetobacter oleivorans]|uniref:glycosyltransferase n=1 Tax=Acinetobacter oleivorans TaxID=1148157 RepID=UPI00125FF4ED|nr:glycosyltransferase [Acinetobacter oleivorans]
MKPQYFFLFPKIDQKKNGLVFALLKRAKILNEQLGISPTIITTEYDRSLAENYWSLIAKNLAPSSIGYLNLYGYFQGTHLKLANKRIHDPMVEMFNSNILKTIIPFTYNQRFHDKNNKNYLYEIRQDDSPTLSYVNTFKKGVKTGRIIYDSYGYLSCIQVINPENQMIITETYYHTKGYPVIIKNYQLKEKNKNIVSNIFIFNKQGVIDEVFDTEAQLIQYWFLKISQLYKNDLMYILIDRAIHFYEPLREIKQENMRFIGTIHATHLNGPDIQNSTINRHYHSYFKYSNELDALVILTERQKQHIKQRFGMEEKLFVIPHIYEKTIDHVNFSNRDPMFCLTIARYDKAKNLDSLIRVFKKVVEVIPNAYLNIYGFGSEYNFLQSQIDEHQLNNHIKLMGYNENTDALYNKASLFLFSSRSEGFGMAVLEALCHGCPVVSYDIDYGPSDMINHDENGYLITFQDEELFAQKVISLLKDERKRLKLSENAYACSQLTDQKQFAQKWQTLFQAIL